MVGGCLPGPVFRNLRTQGGAGLGASRVAEWGCHGGAVSGPWGGRPPAHVTAVVSVPVLRLFVATQRLHCRRLFWMLRPKSAGGGAQV